VTHIFADAAYWIALLNPRDFLLGRASAISGKLSGSCIVTTDLVLTEVLNSCAGATARMRTDAAKSIRSLRANGMVIVEVLTPEYFDAALDLYSKRTDKAWSLTDCLSFMVMERYGIHSALTSDRHFEQAGFKALLR